MAFFRISSPLGYYPANDTQFYFYFCEPEEGIEQRLVLNDSEFTEFKWLTVPQIIDLYTKKKLAVFHP